MGNLDWENVKGNQKKPAGITPQAPETEVERDATPKGKLESPYRKGEDSGMDPKENHRAHDAVADDESAGGEQNRDSGSQPAEELT